jgi:NAD(P)-dependent dehydrogenase (short-subunit alcohol dehydrogenase family)
MAVLTGKAVVITGSGRGIGAACAKGAARQGAAVIVNDIDAGPAEEPVAAIKAEGGTAVACVADITDWDEAGRLIQSCIDNFGKIDGLVNNAALFHSARLDAMDPRAARALVDVNVIGPLYTTGQAIKPMLAQNSGSIVNVVSGAHMGMEGMDIYGATKGAVASMTYTWAIELKDTGVRVNGLSPFGATRMMGGNGMSEEEAAKRLAQLPPAEQNSPVVEFLLSDLSKDVHGQLIRIDRQEVYLYTHPALLVPPAVRSEWSAEALADAFTNEFKGRQIGCGVLGMEQLPVDLKSGYWSRAKAS